MNNNSSEVYRQTRYEGEPKEYRYLWSPSCRITDCVASCLWRGVFQMGSLGTCSSLWKSKKNIYIYQGI